MPLPSKTYLGDGVYASHDGYQIWLETQQGHRIALEPGVMEALKAFDKAVQKAAEEIFRLPETGS